MNHHVQNPWTRSPSLMVNLTVEEAQQLESGLEQLKELCIRSGNSGLTSNQEDAINRLRILLEQANGLERPRGIKGCTP